MGIWGLRSCLVRAPLPRDFQATADMAGQLGYPCTPKEVERRLAEMQDPNQYAVYVAEISKGEIAGWIGVYLFRSVELGKQAEISGLVVSRDARCRGIGKVLLEAAEECARGTGCAVISVRSNVTRERAHGFYRKNGYEWTKTQKTFWKSLLSPRGLHRRRKQDPPR
jgi:ribosomal protein S18 acetylase RimI-like enzyme